MDHRCLRVLVVDDDRILRKLLGALVQHSGCEAMEACDGEEGLAKALDGQPDIIIVDWLMPAMNGIEMVRAIRAGGDGYRPYIILVTCLEDENRLVEAFDAEVDDFISKPFTAKVVAARLRAARRIVELQRENEGHIEALRRYSEELRRSNRNLREQAVTDELTGLPNRRFAMERIQEEWTVSECRQSPLSCMVIDLDGFKQINDSYGHRKGDEVLRTVAGTILKGVRAGDIVCRIGGDEFLVICPNASLDSAVRCGERLLGLVNSLGIEAEGHPFGLSIGAAERRPDIESLTELISLADREMYRAKQRGKNCVCYDH